MKNVTKLTIAAGDDPPSEFRIFTAGEVSTTKGTFTFGPDEAASVMDEYERHGIDLAIDYDHASLSSTSAPDPAQAGKAAGWFALEVRDGELWAVRVRWTEPAAAALRAKEWRFYSPAFTATEDGRITSLLNCALTNGPATRRLEPLMAASAAGEPNMKTIQDALDALEAGDADGAKQILEALLAAEAETPPTEEEPADAEVLARRTLLRATSTKTLTAAAREVQALAKERQELTATVAAFEAAERIRLCTRLVLSGARSPGQTWDQMAYTEGETPVPKPYLARMSLTELRAHVDEEVAAVPMDKRPKIVPAFSPPASDAAARSFVTSRGTVELSSRQMAMCAEMKLDPKAYAESVATQKAVAR